MKYAFPLLVAFFSLFLFGCINTPTSTCPPSDSNCIYSQAVLQQDPYLCYNLPEAQREICFKAATNPLEKKKLQNGQVAAPFGQAQPTKQQTLPAQPPAQETKTELQKEFEMCATSQDSDS